MYYNENNTTLKEYHANYELDPKYKNSLVFGIEMEFEMVEPDYQKLNGIADRLHRNFPHIMCKREGALECGLEVITKPMSYSELASSDWRWLSLLTNAGFVSSEDIGERGMHIHVNRGYFDNSEQVEAVMEKFLDMVECMTFDAEYGAGATNRFAKESGYCKHALSGMYYNEIGDVLLSTNRYDAVVARTNTIEFRAFRPFHFYNDYRDVLSNVHVVQCISELAKVNNGI